MHRRTSSPLEILGAPLVAEEDATDEKPKRCEMFKATLPLLLSFTAYLCTVIVAVIVHPATSAKHRLQLVS
jgi:hypothetical protein